MCGQPTGEAGGSFGHGEKEPKQVCGEIAGFLVPTSPGTRNALMVLQIIDPARGGG
jgi:hypothetical protein